MHCRQRCEDFPPFPPFPPAVFSLAPSSCLSGCRVEFGQLRYLRYRNRPHRRAAAPARPAGCKAAGRAVRGACRALFDLGSTMHRAGTRVSNATGRYYNSSAQMSSTVVKGRQFRFRDFFGSIEGLIWRVEPAITPLVVSLGSNASNAFNADTPSRSSCSCDLQILA